MPLPTPITTSWDDLLEGVTSADEWSAKREVVASNFRALILEDAAPEPPQNLQIEIESQWEADGFTIRYISYNVESDERAKAYLAIPNGPVPEGGLPGVLCIHGTTNWAARRTLGIPPLPEDPHADKPMAGLTYARELVRAGYVTLSPEHFCCASRLPEEGPYDTAAFYRKHPNWSAVGKFTYENRVALTLLGGLPEVDAERLGATGHSLGGQGTIWLSALDERVKCAVPSCPAGAFRENPQPEAWSRDHWYIYFPQIREQLLANERIICDFHEMFALIAPRPCMELFALNDGNLTMNQHRVTMHARLGELYHLLDADAAHAFLTFGDGHSVPDLSRAVLVAWMDRWLKHGGNPLGAWDSRPTPSPDLDPAL